jgi:hypothetical protein
MKKILVFAVFLLVLHLAAPSCLAQSTVPPPASLPGYSVSFSAGYSATTGNATNNGFWGSIAVPLYTFQSLVAKKYDMSLSLRGDYFSLSKPADYVLTGGPEFRLQFSKPNLLNGQAFQPFANVGIGFARNQCVAAQNCAAGVDQTTHAAFKIGGGLDIPVNATMSIRLLELDFIHSSLIPGTGNVVVSNAAQLSAGIGLRF